MLMALTPIWGILAIIISLLGVTVGVIEGIGWQDGLYFGWVTGTTVGYGDITPTRTITRILSILIGIIGIVNTGIIVTIAVTSGKRVMDHEGKTDEIRKIIDEKLKEK